MLIYFTNDLQRRALQLFAFALRDGGYLVLGKAESTSPLPEHFVLTHPRLKVYRRSGERVLIPPARIRDSSPMLPLRLPVARRPGWTEVGSSLRESLKPTTLTERNEQLIHRLPVGVTVVDRAYDVQIINGSARRQLSVHGQAIGEDFVHLLDETIAPRVKAAIDATIRGHDPEPFTVELTSPRADGSETRTIELTVQPVGGDSEHTTADRILIVGVDVTAAKAAARSLEEGISAQRADQERAAHQARQLADANAELLDANQELTTANAELRSANEELLVANEEVQAATEEVETLNEELQATNEELETLNEELQATVEELNTTNDDLEARTIELQESAVAVEHQRTEVHAERDRLLALLDLLDSPILVVDREGVTVKANRSFSEVVGDPAQVSLEGRGGKGDSTDPRLRAARQAFTAKVAAGEKLFDVLGQPLDVDGGYGALIFRKAAD